MDGYAEIPGVLRYRKVVNGTEVAACSNCSRKIRDAIA